jgi:uncharacterized protein YjdB
MKLSVVAIVTITVALSAACAGTPTSPEGRAQAGWTLTLDESVTVTSITVTCHPDPRVHICQATANIANGPPRDISQTDVVWTSSNMSIATVNPLGVVTPLSPGQAVITAAAGGTSGSAVVTVG